MGLRISEGGRVFQKGDVSVKEIEFTVFEILAPHGDTGAHGDSNLCEANRLVLVVGEQHRIEGRIGMTMAHAIKGTLISFAGGSKKTQFCGCAGGIQFEGRNHIYRIPLFKVFMWMGRLKIDQSRSRMEALTCSNCENVLQEGDATIQHFCGHREHTRCFYIRVLGGRLTRPRCEECDEPLLPNDILGLLNEGEDPEIQGNTETLESRHERIREKYLTDPVFQKTVKDHVANLRALPKEARGLRKIIQAKKSALFTEISGIRHQLDALIAPQVNALKTTEEFKKYGKAKARYYSSLVKLRRAVPGYDEYDIRRALLTQRGLRTWRPLSWTYRHSASHLINRTFSYWIRI